MTLIINNEGSMFKKIFKKMRSIFKCSCEESFKKRFVTDDFPTVLTISLVKEAIDKMMIIEQGIFVRNFDITYGDGREIILELDYLREFDEDRFNEYHQILSEYSTKYNALQGLLTPDYIIINQED